LLALSLRVVTLPGTADQYDGRNFATAGGKVSANLARAYLVAPPGGIADSITAAPGTATIKCPGDPDHQFNLLRTTNLAPLPVWTKLNLSPPSSAIIGCFTCTDTSTPGGKGYYWNMEKQKRRQRFRQIRTRRAAILPARRRDQHCQWMALVR
jgi:hypothetical protein